MSKKLVSLFLAVLMLMCIPAALAENSSVTVTDMFDREVTISGPVNRILVLEPAECEIVCALGGEALLVGRGAFCDYPASVLALPALQSGSLTNIEEVLALEPDLVIMNGMDHPKEQVDQLESNGIQVISTYAANIEETYECIRLIGAAIGKQTEAEALVADMQATFADIRAKSPQTGKTVYSEISPLQWGLWSAGSSTFMHELAEMCGVTNIFADLTGFSAVSEEQVLALNPDYIVLMNGMGETSVEEILARGHWADVTAVKNGAIYNDVSSIMTRPAPRLKDAALALYNLVSGTAE